MQKLEALLEIREAAEYIFNGLMSGCIQMSFEAGRAHLALVDRFFLEHPERMDREQYEEARLDIFHFICLIDRAIEETRDG